MKTDRNDDVLIIFLFLRQEEKFYILDAFCLLYLEYRLKVMFRR